MAIDLKHKVGPLPVYAWAGIATVAILASYLYLRRGGVSGSDATGDTGVNPSSTGVLDPTTGVPYADTPGFSGGGGSTAVDGSANGAGGGVPPSLTDELNDVAGLISSLTGLGLINTGGSAAPYDDTGVRDQIAGLQGMLQQGADHSPPPKVGERGATVIRPSAEHGGQLWTFRTGASGKLVPVAKAPAGSKASVKPGASTSGAHGAPKSGSSGTSGKPVAQSKAKVGSIVQKPSAAHGGQLYDFRVNSKGGLTPVRPASKKKK